jgi:CPA1 family monovalent cation:H+ antiporter
MKDAGVLTSEVGIIILLVVLTLIVALVARRLKFPYTLALVLAGLLLGEVHLFHHFTLDPEVVLFLFLPALLFEGAWNTDVQALRDDWLPIFLLAVPGLLLSLGIIALVVHWGAGLPVLLAFLLGAIVSPTDPIAVLGLLRQLGMPKRLNALIEGESLFNDGVGAAVFELVLAAVLLSLHQPSELDGLSPLLVVLKVLDLLGGGLVIGVGVGLLISQFVRVIEDPLFETTVTFCVAYGVYILATLVGSSGLLAVVGAGLTLGSYGRRIGLTELTQETVDTVWEFISYIANSLLFLLVGIEIGQTQTAFGGALSTIFWAIIGVLLGRAIMVYLFLPLHAAFVHWRGNRETTEKHRSDIIPVPPSWYPLILLSGLRGALSLALVLSLQSSIPQLQTLRLAVYGVVLVTLLGQGIGLRVLLPRWPGGISTHPAKTASSAA